jgi:hypothetical protein
MKAKLRSNVARIMKEAGEYQRYQAPELREMNSPEGTIFNSIFLFPANCLYVTVPPFSFARQSIVVDCQGSSD